MNFSVFQKFVLPYLSQIGLIAKTRSGRWFTPPNKHLVAFLAAFNFPEQIGEIPFFTAVAVSVQTYRINSRACSVEADASEDVL
jgi:hypothetical protein